MEKLVICFMLFVMVIFSACKKDDSYAPGGKDEDYVEGWTRVLGIKTSNNDTSTTKYVQGNGRVETDPQPLTYQNCGGPGLGQGSNNCLCFTLIAYKPLPGGKGEYKFTVKNRAWYEVTISWGTDNNTIHSKTPSDNTLNGYETKTYTVVANAVVSKFKIKTNTGSYCSENWVYIPITISVLPIEFTNFTRKREGDEIIATWSTDAPGDVDKFIILWTPTGKREDEVIMKEIPSDPSKKEYTVKYPAVKKTK